MLFFFLFLFLLILSFFLFSKEFVDFSSYCNFPCIEAWIDFCRRHLIGFFLFLSLTIYTAMKVPKVANLHALHHFPDVLKKPALHKLHAELLACLPSLPNMPDLQKLREELTNSLPSMDLLPSPSTWHIVDLLTRCLPERLFHGNYTDVGVLVTFFFFGTLWLIGKSSSRQISSLFQAMQACS